MLVDVVMPQMGESIAEGTVTRWLKGIGDPVERDEPLFEISTDKVDAEIPAPVSGRLTEIRAAAGQTVEVNRIVAVIETQAGASAAAPAPPGAARPAAAPPAPAPVAAPDEGAQDGSGFVSPVVRRMAAEHGVNLAAVRGSGAGGRVTKKDLVAHLGRPAVAGASRPAAAVPIAPPVSAEGAPPWLTVQTDAPAFAADKPTTRVAMTQMRKKIAEHMLASRRASAHVHSVFEVDMSRAVALRERHKQAYVERHGTRLTFMALFVKAACDALRAWPIVNSSIEGDEIVYRRELNVGIAVALDWGLIVPVIRNADELSIAGLCKRVSDLAQRARAKKLNPEEVHGGTFTITNPGQFGGLYGLPIINQPQVAILGIGGIQKRPVVVGDAIAIRSMMYLSMSYDHRAVDGAVADQFLARVRHGLEQFDEALL
jgi:2-oxoglutarate dehydrogenase E2 component (dihydrolipoamide succinyltransferase)